MAETLTPNYSWTKPDPGASANTWGATLNKDLDGIDAQVFANQSAAAAGQSPIGSIVMFAGTTPPTGWTWCAGAAVSRTTYAALFAVIGANFGAGDGSTTFNLPNLFGRIPMGYDGGGWAMGAAGGEVNHTLALGEMPVHAHPITDVAHTHSISQTPHAHGDPGHTHGVNDPTHSHVVPGVALGGGVNIQPGSGFNQTGNVGTTASGTGISIQAAGTGIQTAYANINGSATNASGTGLSTTQNVGSSGAHNNMPPYLVIGFIIRCI